MLGSDGEEKAGTEQRLPFQNAALCIVATLGAGSRSQQAWVRHGDGLWEETEQWAETANPWVTWLRASL